MLRDLYDGKGWKDFAPTDFLRDPEKVCPVSLWWRCVNGVEDGRNKAGFSGRDVWHSLLIFLHRAFWWGKSLRSAKKCEGNRAGAKAGGYCRNIYRIHTPMTKSIRSFSTKEQYILISIDRLDKLKLVEPLDLRITTNTLDTVIDYKSAVYWDKSLNNDEFKRNNPLLLVRVEGMLITSIMIVFQKATIK